MFFLFIKCVIVVGTTTTTTTKMLALRADVPNIKARVMKQLYSEIPILRPPLGPSKSGLKDHFWTVPKVVSNQMYTCVLKMKKRIA